MIPTCHHSTRCSQHRIESVCQEREGITKRLEVILPPTPEVDSNFSPTSSLHPGLHVELVRPGIELRILAAHQSASEPSDRRHKSNLAKFHLSVDSVSRIQLPSNNVSNFPGCVSSDCHSAGCPLR